MSTKTTSACVIYAEGVCCCSVCAPKEWSIERVLTEVNNINPTDIESKWQQSKDATFKDGELIPVQCTDYPGRHHWLLAC